MKSKIFFTREITPEKVVELYPPSRKGTAGRGGRFGCTPARWETRTF